MELDKQQVNVLLIKGKAYGRPRETKDWVYLVLGEGYNVKQAWNEYLNSDQYQSNDVLVGFTDSCKGEAYQVVYVEPIETPPFPYRERT